MCYMKLKQFRKALDDCVRATELEPHLGFFPNFLLFIVLSSCHQCTLGFGDFWLDVLIYPLPFGVSFLTLALLRSSNRTMTNLLLRS